MSAEDRYVSGGVRVGGTSIQLLAPDMDVGGDITAATASAAVDLEGAAVVRFATDGNFYVNFGASGVVAAAGDMLIQTGSELVLVPPGATHFAHIRDATTDRAVNWRKLGL